MNTVEREYWENVRNFSLMRVRVVVRINEKVVLRDEYVYAV